jgi:hypothetical protein
MNKKQVLERIIEESGNCTWSNPSICKNCPLGQLRLDEKNEYMNCIEAVGADGLSEEEADLKYLGAAQKALLSLEIDEILKDKSEV